ncbi:DUF952 domain-containing protein [Rhizobium sp. TRM95111]|uniref:DUF952 domain-containing protein n=1 Tax=Rhizobium alarense TaxID=2846851 RepID=UPI001F333A24|nr:DUF952 domain-containing protein [Rhizobium alarense]MCF3643166.1 DUF952 domain-containing protein [Rhizobium alarense]
MSSPIYKIVPASLWQKARETGTFVGSLVDLTDGFIHFSTATQTIETAARHFKGQKDLILVAVDEEKLGDTVIYEPSRGGDLFPHLYGTLPMEAVIWERPLPLGDDGLHVFPEMEA